MSEPLEQDIVEEFCRESFELIGILSEILDHLEDDPCQSKKLEEFGQIIDRIMGTANTLDLKELATFCELGKTIGYKSSQIDDRNLLEIVVAVLFDTIHLVNLMLESLKNGKNQELANLNTKTFADRMRWLSEKFKDVERASCDIQEETKLESQDEIDDLLDSLGL